MSITRLKKWPKSVRPEDQVQAPPADAVEQPSDAAPMPASAEPAKSTKKKKGQ